MDMDSEDRIDSGRGEWAGWRGEKGKEVGTIVLE